MDHYVTGAAIKSLREKQRLTQADLASILCVSDKTISKWENGRGFPDISLIEPLSRALHISVPELLSGESIINKNRSSNMLRSQIFVCPICGNVIHAKGNAMISCCGIQLPAMEADEADDEHSVSVEKIEDEFYVSVPHEMTKEHYISFFAYVTSDRFDLKTLYPEGSPEAYFFSRGNGWLYYYCNRHGLFKKKLER